MTGPKYPHGAVGARQAHLVHQRERATRAFLGNEEPGLDGGEMIDLADDAEGALPITCHLRGMRAAEVG